MTTIDRCPGPLTDNSPCGFGPSLYCIGGPLDLQRVKPLRRKEGRVHPVYRTSRGHVMVGEPDSGEPHYVLRNHGWLGDSYYDYIVPGPVGCEACGARFEMVALVDGRWVSFENHPDRAAVADATWSEGLIHADTCTAAQPMSRPEAPLDWWWLSFVDRATDGTSASVALNLGVAIVAGTGVESCTQTAWDYGFNPGGEVLAQRLGRLRLPQRITNRLLTDPADIAEAQIILEAGHE